MLCGAGGVGPGGSGFSRFRLGRSRRHTMKSAPPIINSHHDRDVSADSGQWQPKISAGRDSPCPRPSRQGERLVQRTARLRWEGRPIQGTAALLRWVGACLRKQPRPARSARPREEAGHRRAEGGGSRLPPPQPTGAGLRPSPPCGNAADPQHALLRPLGRGRALPPACLPRPRALPRNLCSAALITACQRRFGRRAAAAFAAREREPGRHCPRPPPLPGSRPASAARRW